ncbi:unnamed protein product [Callosobruchus maculatus]|uniref:Uncharacterized protein n=1 Tax=Callosobruchus maculatus TaxID=64391 RepID=A0A653D672_CALMS|nr:unnamed protein product [Callosobruchus maculatus]
MYVQGTGGGEQRPSPKPYCEEENQLLATISVAVEGLNSETDSDALYGITGIPIEEEPEEPLEQEIEDVVVEWTPPSTKLLRTPVHEALQPKKLQLASVEEARQQQQLEHSMRMRNLKLQNTILRNKAKQQAKTQLFNSGAHTELKKKRILFYQFTDSCINFVENTGSCSMLPRHRVSGFKERRIWNEKVGGLAIQIFLKKWIPRLKLVVALDTVKQSCLKHINENTANLNLLHSKARKPILRNDQQLSEGKMCVW